jgi:uncharacterized membrane protein
MADKPVYLYVATYDSLSDATADYEALKILYKNGEIATYDASIITKDTSGKVHVTKHEKPTQHGAWTGLVVGAVAGLIFPPSIIMTAAVGAGVGAMAGHLAKGMSREDMKKVGSMLENSTAALVVLAETRLQPSALQALTHATEHHESEVSVNSKEFQQDYDQMVKEAASSIDTTESASTDTSPHP